MLVKFTVKRGSEVVRILERELNLFTQFQSVGRTIHRELMRAANDLDMRFEDLTVTVEVIEP